MSPGRCVARFRVAPVLGGTKTEAERASLANHRREYRLLGSEGREVFQRVVYCPWREERARREASNAAPAETITDGPVLVGVWIHAQPEKSVAGTSPVGSSSAASLDDPWVEVGGRRFTWRRNSLGKPVPRVLARGHRDALRSAAHRARNNARQVGASQPARRRVTRSNPAFVACPACHGGGGLCISRRSDSRCRPPTERSVHVVRVTIEARGREILRYTAKGRL